MARKWGQEKIFEEVIVEKISDLVKTIILQIQAK